MTYEEDITQKTIENAIFNYSKAKEKALKEGFFVDLEKPDDAKDFAESIRFRVWGTMPDSKIIKDTRVPLVWKITVIARQWANFIYEQNDIRKEKDRKSLAAVLYENLDLKGYEL